MSALTLLGLQTDFVFYSCFVFLNASINILSVFMNAWRLSLFALHNKITIFFTLPRLLLPNGNFEVSFPSAY